MIKGPYPNRLGERMKAAGITDPRLAALAGTTKQQIFKLRRGERNLTVQWARRLAPHLGVSWQDLVEGAPDLPERSRIEWMAAYDALSEEQRQVLLATAKLMAPGNQPAAPSPPGRSKPRAVACVTPMRLVRARR